MGWSGSWSESVSVRVIGITDLVTRPLMIGIDFEDVRAIMSEKGRTAAGLGRGTGADRARLAVEAAVRYPLLDGGALSEARGILVNIMAGPDLGMGEFALIGDVISSLVSKDDLVIVGTALAGRSRALRARARAPGENAAARIPAGGAAGDPRRLNDRSKRSRPAGRWIRTGTPARPLRPDPGCDGLSRLGSPPRRIRSGGAESCRTSAPTNFARD